LPLASNDQDADFVNLNIASGRKPGEEVGAASAVGAVVAPGRGALEPEERKLSYRNERHASPPSNHYSEEDEVVDESVGNYQAERQRMLEMIKAKQQIQMKQSEAELLDGIGDGILRDLESSLHEKKKEASPKNDESRYAERMGDSTIDAFLPSQRSQNHRDESPGSAEAKKDTKKVHFA